MASSFLWSLLFIISMVPILVSSHQFQVGGDRGWAKPAGNNSQTYNQWAAKNRFHVGDTIYFKYQKDSVLVVNRADYENCTVSNPISKFDDGDTEFEFDRYGFFYFVSGQPGHCESGQRLIIRVMVHPAVEPEPPQSAPPPKAGGGDGDGSDSDEFGTPGFNSTTKLSVGSCFATVFIAAFIILHLFT